MREIRFRGQQIYEHKWVYGGVHIADDEALIIERRKGNDCFHSPVKRESIGQFTGLHDKNGVEIYEGDILNVCNGSLNGVEWMEKPYAVEYVLNKGFNMCMFCWVNDGQNRMDSTHWCEVIGNIYENPELLK